MQAPRAIVRFGSVAALVLAASCSAPPPLHTNDGPPASTELPETTGPAAPALAPVPTPAGVVAKGRARDLRATLRVIAALIGAPSDAIEGASKKTLVELIGRSTRLEIDASMAEQIALDAPVDFAVTASDKGAGVAVSIGLSSIDGAKAAAGVNVAEVQPGVFMIGGEKAKGSCGIFAASGTPARLVCGPTEQDVKDLGPYLARTVSVEPSSDKDLVADLDVAALNTQFASTVRKIAPVLPTIAVKRWGNGNKRYDDALEEGVRFIASDLGAILQDVKNVHLEGRVDGTQGLNLRVVTKLEQGAKSWFARTALGTAQSRVPEMLWKAPADASGAIFGTVVDPAAFGDIGKALRGMIEGSLEAAKVGNDKERKQIADLVDLPFAKGVQLVATGGFGRVTKPAPAKTQKELEQAHFDRLLGWYVVGTSQRADAWAKWLKDASTAFNQPGVQKALKKRLGKSETISVASAPPPKELGKGSFQLNVAFSSAVGGESAQGTFFILLEPDGDRSWIGMGFDRNELVERLLRAKDGRDALKDRGDLAELRAGAATGGALLTLQSFRSSVYAMMLYRASAIAAQAKDDKTDLAAQALTWTDQLYGALPKKGLAPMFVRTSVEGTALTLDITMNKSVLDDASALVRQLNGGGR